MRLLLPALVRSAAGELLMKNGPLQRTVRGHAKAGHAAAAVVRNHHSPSIRGDRQVRWAGATGFHLVQQPQFPRTRVDGERADRRTWRVDLANRIQKLCRSLMTHRKESRAGDLRSQLQPWYVATAFIPVRDKDAFSGTGPVGADINPACTLAGWRGVQPRRCRERGACGQKAAA